MQIYCGDGQMSLFDLDTWSGKMCQESFPAEPPKARTSASSSRRSFELKYVAFLSLDLTPGAGNLLGEFYWERSSPWRGDVSPLNTGVSPREEIESTLSRILVADPPKKYYLTRKACRGILRRAYVRGKELPEKLKRALEIQAGALRAHSGMKQQTFIAAGFSAGQGSKAGGIGYQEECAPTLKAADSGTNMVPSVLCHNDQGGGAMDCSLDVAGALRAQEHGHQPLVYENHGIDARYTGPHKVAPTMSARYGTGGNNVPLVQQEPVFCLPGNTINRKPQNGGNGMGCQEDVAYTLTATDHHAVFARQRVDVFKDGEVVSTQSARQYKDATDLVMDVAGLDCRNARENGDLCGTLQKGTSGNSLNSIHPVRSGLLIRRLLPLECERLQGFPDGWTDIPGASDSARYKALGNSVAIPCVDFVLQGIALALRAS